MISYAGEDLASIDFNFNDNINETKRILGKKYDIYQNVKQYDVNVYNIKEFNNYFAVYYYDDDEVYVSIMDSNYNIIKTYEGYEAERPLYEGKIKEDTEITIRYLQESRDLEYIGLDENGNETNDQRTTRQ